jgi:ATP-binding cassette subfamily B protein
VKDWIRLLGLMARIAFRYEPRRTVICLALGVVMAGLAAATATAQRWLVDSVTTGTSAGVLAAVLLGAAALALSTNGHWLQGNLRSDVSHHVAMRLSRQIAADAAAIPHITHLEHPPFLDRIVMIRRGALSISGAGWLVVGTLEQLVALSLSIWLLASVHPLLILAVLFAAAPLYTANRGRQTMQRAADQTAEAERIENDLHSLCIDPEPAKEIRTARSGPAISELADGIWSSALRRQLIAQMRASGLELSGWVVYVGGFVAALTLTIALAGDQRATTGDLVLVVYIAGQLRGQLSRLVHGVVGLGAAGRIINHFQWFTEYAVNAKTSGGTPPPQRITQGIDFREVSFRYPGSDKSVLSGVNLRVPAGSTMAIVGINGAGKSTLVKLLTGMYRPTSGVITVDNEDLNTINLVDWRKQSTGTFQDHVKFQFKAFETVGVGRLSAVNDRPAVEEAVREAGAGTVVATLPTGLDSQLGRIFQGAELSHGQWQRLALARGRMRSRPLLVILDEPTAALDPHAEHEVYEQFAEISRATARELGTITVLVSHRFSTVSMADLIVVLDQGVIVESGTHADLLARGGSYALHYRTQRQAYQPAEPSER